MVSRISLDGAVSHLLEALDYKPEIAGSIPEGVIDIILLVAHWPWGRHSL